MSATSEKYKGTEVSTRKKQPKVRLSLVQVCHVHLVENGTHELVTQAAQVGDG